MIEIGRRRFVALGVGAAVLAVAGPRRSAGGECRVRLVGAVDRERLEASGIVPYDLAKLRDTITPSDDFFVRSHMGVPYVRQARLEISGHVARPAAWSLDDLRRLPRREAAVTLECAGNSLVQAEGLVSTARFGGCALADLLDRVGASSAEDEIVFTGADAASEGGEHYARSMKMRQAVAQGALLAWEMNGAALSADHGAPLRLVVPGWYGMASVKWLERIELRAEPFRGRFQTEWYVNRVRAADGSIRIEPVTRLGVKSVVAAAEARAAGAVRLHGAAWGGEGGIARVEATVDGGHTWRPATLEGRPIPNVWRLWHFDWKPAAGSHVVAARAFDAAGAAQPLSRPPELAEAAYARNEVVGRKLEVTC